MIGAHPASQGIWVTAYLYRLISIKKKTSDSWGIANHLVDLGPHKASRYGILHYNYKHIITICNRNKTMVWCSPGRRKGTPKICGCREVTTGLRDMGIDKVE